MRSDVAARGAIGRRRALQRLLEYYLRAADRADAVITPQRYRVPLRVRHVRPLPVSLDDYDGALAWLTTERRNLVAVCVAAGRHGLDVACWQLAYALRGYYYVVKPLGDWVVTHRAALAATRRLRDWRAEASTRNNLGLAYLELGRPEAAAHQYRRAAELADRAGDRHGVQTARANHAWLRFTQRRYADFLVEIAPAYTFYVRAAAHRNAAITLRGMGLAEGELGRLDEAVTHLHEALSVFAEFELRLDVAMTLNALGDVYLRAGAATDAERAYRRGLAAADACGSRFERDRARRGLSGIDKSCVIDYCAASRGDPRRCDSE